MVNFLRNISGRVIELCPPYKAIIVIDASESTAGGQRALLWSNKLTVDGKVNLIDEYIGDYLSINSKVRFCCHTLDKTLSDNCPWYITAARRQNACDMVMDDNFSFGIVSGTGYIADLDARQGVLQQIASNGEGVQVLFHASKVFIYGERCRADEMLEDVMQSKNYLFDAVPVNPFENDYHCKWVATVVWQGTKPPWVFDQENTSECCESSSELSPPVVKVPTLLSEIRTLVYDPKGLFWRGYGVISKIFDDEFGLIMGRRKLNHHDSVMFHRNFVTLFKNRLTNRDLRKFFKKGSRVQFVAVPAPEKFMVQWIASHVSIDEDSHLDVGANTMP